MRPLLIILFSISYLIGFSQDKNADTLILELSLPYQPANLQLIKRNTPTLEIEILNCYQHSFKGMPSGEYKLAMVGSGEQHLVLKDKLTIEEGQVLIFRCTINGPCLFDHPQGYVPVCPKNHSDNIIPIVYGLLIHSSLDTAGKKKYWAGGCVTYGCDPHFYCTIHKIKF
jgi:hypothetical protein